MIYELASNIQMSNMYVYGDDFIITIILKPHTFPST